MAKLTIPVMHKVSVVITTCNLELYLEEAILSVLKQTRIPDEIIIADDHSTDETEKIFERFKGKVIVIRHENKIGALKNTLSGLMEASGDIIGFLDADDSWMPDKLEKIVAEFEKDEQYVIISHDHEHMDEQGHFLDKEDDTNSNVNRITQNYSPDEWGRIFRKSILFREGYWFGSAYMVRRSVIDMVSFNRMIGENEELARWSFLDLVMGPYIVATNPKGKIGFVNEKLFRYRSHHSNSSGSTADRQRAMSSLQRSQYVNRLTRIAIRDHVNDPGIDKQFRDLDTIYELVRYQYEGKKISALVQFIRIIPKLIAHHLFIKEFKRLGLTTFLGVNKFIQLKNKHA